MSAPIVVLDIAGPDQDALKAFYAALFGWNTAASQFTISVVTPLSATICGDPAEK